MISIPTRASKAFSVQNRIQLIVLEEQSAWKDVDHYGLANWGGQNA